MIDRVATTDAGREFRVRSAVSELAGLRAGDSVAVNGACLTVRECGEGWFAAAAVETTLGRTTMGEWAAGRRVNLERPLAVGERFGGHFVLGHVDGVADVTRVARRGDATLVDLAMPAALMPLVIPHGSIAIDGVSLTVNALADPASVQLSLIEFTLRETTLGDLRGGERVHVEGDVIGKYIQRLASPLLAPAEPPSEEGSRTSPRRA